MEDKSIDCLIDLIETIARQCHRNGACTNVSHLAFKDKLDVMIGKIS